jgi:hypothetical protein
MPRTSLSERHEDLICKEYTSGATLQELGKKYGVAHTTIRNVLLSHGVKIRPSGAGSNQNELSKLRKKLTHYLSQQGLPVPAIAEALEISESRVRLILSKPV